MIAAKIINKINNLYFSKKICFYTNVKTVVDIIVHGYGSRNENKFGEEDLKCDNCQ